VNTPSTTERAAGAAEATDDDVWRGGAEAHPSAKSTAETNNTAPTFAFLRTLDKTNNDSYGLNRTYFTNRWRPTSPA
jgi:hypothetical protein